MHWSLRMPALHCTAHADTLSSGPSAFLLPLPHTLL